MHIQKTDTVLFRIDTIYYDIKLVDDGIRSTVVEGIITVNPQVTIN